MDSIFTKIIKGQIPSYKIGENDWAFAFLDIAPLAKGHTLVVPKIQVDQFYELDEEWFTQLNLFARQVAKALKQRIPCQRIGSAVIGLEVPHAHIHLVPIWHMSDLDFTKPKLKLDPEEMKAIAANVASALNGDKN